MTRVFTLCMLFGTLSPVLLAAGATVYSGGEKRLQVIPGLVPISYYATKAPRMTCINKLQLKENYYMRFKDSTEGDLGKDLGEYCWSTGPVGESVQDAYVVLPVDTTAVGHEMLEVKTTAPTATVLHAHSGPTNTTESCGLRYDVTHHFNSQDVGTKLCVRVIAKDDALGDSVLKNPPYLVTIWQRNQN